MDCNQDEKPCKVETPQGFSVIYRNRLLYSKYSPARQILATIASLRPLPGTAFLCCSPVLTYGLSELLSLMPEGCAVICCEYDDALRNFEENSEEFRGLLESDGRLFFPDRSDLMRLPLILNARGAALGEGRKPLPPPGTFRRAVRIDFSAGVGPHQEFYEELERACMKSVRRFWTNRFTLVRFGRKYSENMFRNLSRIAETTPIGNFFGRTDRPIIVFGAGESADFPSSIADRDRYCILCADTALRPLASRGIIPDGVFIEEAQNVIAEAFIGTAEYGIRIFAGLTAVPSIMEAAKDPRRVSFFASRYTDSGFLDRLSKEPFFPPENIPLGSVGLTAVFYALKFRSGRDVPVFIYGLDFSYSAGRTHMRGTFHGAAALSASSRLVPPHNYSASFSETAVRMAGKNGKDVFTTPALLGYRDTFAAMFGKTPRLLDGGCTGLPLGIPSGQPALRPHSADTNRKDTDFPDGDSFPDGTDKSLTAYFRGELDALTELKWLLTGGAAETGNLAELIEEKAEPREYLYLHFPDGWRFSMDLPFLKRISIETDFFIKKFRLILEKLDSRT